MRNNTRTKKKNKRVCKAIHCARHTLGLRLLKKSGNLYLVQRVLGHTNPATTASFYADIAFEDMREAVNGLYSKEGKGKK
jgi:site-specific recombinase XerD